MRGFKLRTKFTEQVLDVLILMKSMPSLIITIRPVQLRSAPMEPTQTSSLSKQMKRNLNARTKSSAVAAVKVNSGQHSSISWWRHQMETFSALLAIYAGIHRSPVISPHKGQWCGALMFSDLRPNKQLSKQWWGWWFQTSSYPLWRHRNVSRYMCIVFVVLCVNSVLPDSIVCSYDSFIKIIRKWSHILKWSNLAETNFVKP